MRSNLAEKYVHISKLCNNNKDLELLAIDQKPPFVQIINNNLIQKKSINFNNTYKVF